MKILISNKYSYLLSNSSSKSCLMKCLTQYKTIHTAINTINTNIKFKEFRNRAFLHQKSMSKVTFNDFKPMEKETIIQLLENIGNRREVELYLQHFTDPMTNRYALLKVGGAVLKDDLEELIDNICFLQRVGLVPIVLHGAGPQLNQLLEEANVEPNYFEGIRVTDASTLKLVSKVFLEMNSKLVEGLEKRGVRARGIQSGVFTADYLDFNRYGYVGKILDVNKDLLLQTIESGAVPILTSMAHNIEGQSLNVNADVAASMLAKVMEPLKIVYLNDTGGMVNKETKQIIPEIQLDQEFEEYLKLDWVKYGTKLKLVQIKELLDYLPRSSSVSITNAKNLKKELFTVKGAGTLIRRGFKVMKVNTIEALDRDRLRKLLHQYDTQVIKGELSVTRYLESFKGDETIYFDEVYQAFAVLTQLPKAIGNKLNNVRFIEKLVFSKQAELLGLLDSMMKQVLSENSKLVWWVESNPKQALEFHFQHCDGAFSAMGGRLFWKGLSVEEVELLLNQLETMLSNAELHGQELLGVPRSKLMFKGNLNSSNTTSSSTSSIKKPSHKLITSKSFSTFANSATPVRLGLIGARGHTGQELIKILNQHPNMELKHISSRELKNQRLTSYVKSELYYELISPETISDYSEVDAWVLALPNKLAENYASKILGSTILDLSADYRFDSTWYYGLPELYPPNSKDNGDQLKRISNPGCYATSAQLGLRPFLLEMKDQVGTPSVFSVSGYSGAGTTPSNYNNPTFLADRIVPYQLTDHIHEHEIGHHLQHRIQFTPHVAPFFRGITSTIHIPFTSEHGCPLNEDQLYELYKNFYKNSPFIKVQREVPDLRNVVDTPYGIIGGFKVSKDRSHVVVVVILDNLMKGAASQAIQNLNLAFGLDMKLGMI